MLRYGTDQRVNDYTRCTNTSTTLIDYVVTNAEGVNATVHNIPKISDHSVISVNFSSKHSNIKNNVIYRSLNDDVFEKINLELISCDWLYGNADVNVVYENMLEQCKTILNNNAPIIKRENKHNQVPWYDTEVKNKARERDQAYKNFKNSSVTTRNLCWERYKNKRNEVVNLLKTKRVKYYENKIDGHKNDSKEMWRSLKTLINGDRHFINFKNIKFHVNGTRSVAGSELEAANNFNNFFIDSIVDISNNNVLMGTWLHDGLNIIESQFNEFKILHLHELKLLVTKMKLKNNIDEVLTSNFIKKTFVTMGYGYLNFINTSLESGNFPYKLKTSKITPIPKIQGATEQIDFRPINTLPDIEKLLELAVYEQLWEYFNLNNLFLGCQSGFREKHSCETAIQLTVTNWKQDIDANKYVVAVFLDFKRAFETIDRQILLEKLSYYGIKDNVLKWFQQYLSNRLQVTKVGDAISECKSNDIGVPQGSILGPLLFIIYLNDINYIECDFMNLFADDTLISCSGTDVEETIHRMNNILNKVCEYLKLNKLTLNVKKTKAMILNTQYKLSKINTELFALKINNDKIDWVQEIKYLGVILDSKLNFKSHFEYTKKKITKKMYFLSRISPYLSIFTKMTIFQTIIQPHFDYCSTMLYLLNKNQLQCLQKLQNRGMRIILKCNRYTPIKSMLETLNWLMVEKRIYLRCMTFIFKLTNQLLPSYFNQFITTNNRIHQHYTRARNDFHISRTKYVSSMKTLFHKGLNEFNKLPEEIKSSNSVNVFKRKLTSYLNVM